MGFRFSARPLFLAAVTATVSLSSLPALQVSSLAAAEPEKTTSERLDELLSGDSPESIDDLGALEKRFREIATRVIPCTVGVRVGGAAGSGVIVSKDGYVLTAGHVSGRAGRDVTLIFQNGKTVRGKTLGANYAIDSGLIKITEDGEYPFVQMGKSESLEDGQWCMATGHPGGFQKGRTSPVRVGRILRNRRNALTTDCVLVGGDSGGPLFNMKGEVIGINSRIGQSFASNIHVPIDTYHDTWERLNKGEMWGRELGGNTPRRGGPYLGVTSDPDANDCKILRVMPNTPAAKAGIRPGDVVIKLGDDEIKTFQQMAQKIGQKKPGDKVKLTIRRGEEGEETVELEVTLGRYGDSSAPIEPVRGFFGPDDSGPDEDEPKEKEKKAEDDEEEEEEPRRGRRRGRGREDDRNNLERFQRQFEQFRRRERQRRPGSDERNHSSILDAFKPVVADATRSTVRLFRGDETISFGALVSEDGVVVTKASEIDGDVECELVGDESFAARLVGVSDKHDLAILRLEIEDPKDLGDARPVVWAEGNDPAIGSFLATCDLEGSPRAVGVLSVDTRALQPRGILGIAFERGQSLPRIGEIIPDSGASRAGLEAGDLILQIDDIDVASGEDLVEILRTRSPGDKVKLRIRRDKDIKEITATLGSVLPQDRQARFDRMNVLSGDVSDRRSNFPSVLQHDTVLYPDLCGGPIVALDGKVVGINIARAGRVDSLAIPGRVVRTVVAELLIEEDTPSIATLAKISIQDLRDRINELDAKPAADSKKLLESLKEEAKRRAKQPNRRRI